LFKKALELGNEDQKARLIENNGKVEGIEKVREVYRELGIDRISREFQREFLEDLKSKLDTLSSILPVGVIDLVIDGLQVTDNR
jgi:hypothetical protein